MAFNGQGGGSAPLLNRIPKSEKSAILKSAIQLKESGIPLKIEIRSPSSTDKQSGILYLELRNLQCISDYFIWGRGRRMLKQDFFSNRLLSLGTTCKGCTWCWSKTLFERPIIWRIPARKQCLKLGGKICRKIFHIQNSSSTHAQVHILARSEVWIWLHGVSFVRLAELNFEQPLLPASRRRISGRRFSKAEKTGCSRRLLLLIRFHVLLLIHPCH